MGVAVKRTVALLSIVAFMLMAVGFLPSPADAADTVVYRVNAGGPQLQGTPAWSADSQASPSPYVNTVDIGNLTFSTTQTIDMSDP
jgi:hypothetical protein